jgi:ATP-dependent exoDNAse (exonuclease V) alpha subunit
MYLLVAELNRPARDHRLDRFPASFEVRLADGNQASVGDVIITRSNDRRLRLSATDWVKNGDRWTITRVGRGGGLTVRHNQSQRIIRLPADYVSTSTGLSYATTVHSAQGVTADTMHGLLTGQESRQQLYTMLTRGRHQPLLHAGGRRRRPSHRYPTRHHCTAHPDRDAAADHRPR